MRKIRLSDTDGALFDEEMIPQDYEYLAKHKATFCRMWTDQGVKFWKQYVEVFRSYILRYSLLGDLTFDASQLQGTLEFAFVVITTYFVEGKVNQAKMLLNQIADLGKSRPRFMYLDSKSVRKDPFYTKDTRDIFREFFGPANEKSSYIKVYLLTPVYMKFGGSIVRCLSKWMEAKEINPDDDSYYVPPVPIEINTTSCPVHARESSPSPSSVLCDAHVTDFIYKFKQQYLKGTPTSPVQLHFWEAKDPRFCYPENPLFNPDAISSDWRDDLTFEKFLEFYVWGSSSEALVKLEDQCPDCQACRKAKKKKKKKKKAAKNADECVCEGFPDIVDSGDACQGSNAENWMLDAMAKVCTGACVHSKDNGPGQAELTAHPSPLASQLSASIALQHTAAEDIDALMNGMTLQAEKLDKRLDMIYMQMNAALVCSEQPDCHCSKCVLSRKFSEDYMKDDSGISLLLGISPNGMKGNEQPAGQKPKSREMADVREMSSPDVINRRARTPFGQRMLGKKMVTKRRKEVMKLPLPGETILRAHFEVQTREDPEKNASEMCVTLVDVDLTQGTLPADFEGMYKLGKVVIQSLTYEFLDRVAKDVPIRFSAEGRDWCLIEIDYRQSKEASGVMDTTHFILKLSNSGINSARGIAVLKGITLELLHYVACRKKRPSPGWILNADDIFVFLQSLGMDYLQVKGTTFNITTGAMGIDLINPEEFSQWLMTLPPILRTTPYSARRYLADTRDLISKISEEPELAAGGIVPPKPTTEDSAADKPNTSKTKQKKSNKNKTKREDEKPAGAASSVGAVHVVQNGLSVQSDKAQAAGDADHTLQLRKKQPAAASATSAKSSGNPPEVQTDKKRETNDVREKREGRMSDIDSADDEDMETERVRMYGKVMLKRFNEVVAELQNNFNRCSNCDILELYPPPFGKCGRCVAEKVPKPRYYCGEECQRAHWSEHCQEHAEGI